MLISGEAEGGGGGRRGGSGDFGVTQSLAAVLSSYMALRL